MTIAKTDLEYLANIVATHTGNAISLRKSQMLEQRLGGFAKSNGHDNVESLVNQLRQRKNTLLETRIAEAATVNETSFFRDSHPFTAIGEHILPKLVVKEGSNRPINIWSAACSTGQEPYSLAITIREKFANKLNVKILASDISQEVLEKASSGEYSQMEANRGMPASRLIRHFDRAGANWRVKQEVRDLVEFKRVNLASTWPICTKFDVVLIRNVLIYFERDAKREILKRICEKMNPEGYLFLGSSEMLGGLDVPLISDQINDTICFRPTSS